ncbi:glutamate-5-semialdehyde dehydrogenase [Chrysiogenes arsenatis]|uniref:glutamate-5-semialdehyde dehydrogenase n=1 Tax=Chrysiogenes arsenatis TaxID=309797 RepID=UPI00040B500F|nr:glutamate-5-semialdehyde dehydrogenase [Chrysiogenes arsenatis]
MQQAALQFATRARNAKTALALLDAAKKRKLIYRMAEQLVAHSDLILEHNAIDMAEGRKAGLSKALLDRLLLSPERIEEMAQSLREIADLDDPVGEMYEFKRLDNGLQLAKMRVPIGTVLIIYESRPNVTSDAAGLCIKSGNSCILRCGKEALNSANAIGKVLQQALSEMKLPVDAITVIDDSSRELLEELLKLHKHIDLVVPRGGEGLIQFVTDHSKIPIVKHDKGLCHIYIDEHAQIPMAKSITLNAKVQRPGVCNAAETLLVHQNIAARILPELIADLIAKGVEIRGCEITRELSKNSAVVTAQDVDWDTEYLDLILSVRVVPSLQAAIDHINTHGSQHSEAIVTDHYENARHFQQAVDSAAVYVNASTRFTDGGQFGMGAEIGISTQKLHCRGPMGVRDLTSSKFVINGNGQIR